MPILPWVMRMTWQSVAFLHWPVSPETLRPLIPARLELDTHEGQAWLGITPLFMHNVRLRCLPVLTGTSEFPEPNVRTYVIAGGKPGVWFFSLDAATSLAVFGARVGFGLPYFSAKMSCQRDANHVLFQSRRTFGRAQPADLEARYRPTGDTHFAEPGSLEYWLIVRYCLYTRHSTGWICRGHIHRSPWPLQRAEAEILQNSMTEPLGVRLKERPALVDFAERIDVVAWGPEPI
jgi:hypothetical protein